MTGSVSDPRRTTTIWIAAARRIRRRDGRGAHHRPMEPRPRDFVGPAVLVIVLVALVLLLVVGNIPNRPT